MGIDQKKKRLKLVNNILWGIILGVFTIGLIVGSMKTSDIYNNKRGIVWYKYIPVIVVSNSMYPTIKVNAFVIMEYTNIENIKEGDIIIYNYGDIDISHRVIEKYELNGEVAFETKGDNNKVSDGVIVNKDNYIGRITFICNSASILIDHFINDDLSLNKNKLVVTWLIVILTLYSLSILAKFIDNVNRTRNLIKNKLIIYDNDSIVYNISSNIKIVQLYRKLITKYNKNELSSKDIIIISTITELVDNNLVIDSISKLEKNL